MTRALRQDSAPSRSCLARKMARRCLPLQVTMLAAAFALVASVARRRQTCHHQVEAVRSNPPGLRARRRQLCRLWVRWKRRPDGTTSSSSQASTGSELFEYPQQPAAAAKLKDRARRVALADGECPAETGDGPILRIMTIALILAVNDAVNELWKENANEIKKRCGPSMPKGLIDRQELFAFVLNDVLGRPLLPHDAAREVGQTGDNAVAGPSTRCDDSNSVRRCLISSRWVFERVCVRNSMSALYIAISS